MAMNTTTTAPTVNTAYDYRKPSGDLVNETGRCCAGLGAVAGAVGAVLFACHAPMILADLVIAFALLFTATAAWCATASGTVPKSARTLEEIAQRRKLTFAAFAKSNEGRAKAMLAVLAIAATGLLGLYTAAILTVDIPELADTTVGMVNATTDLELADNGAVGAVGAPAPQPQATTPGALHWIPAVLLALIGAFATVLAWPHTTPWFPKLTLLAIAVPIVLLPLMHGLSMLIG